MDRLEPRLKRLMAFRVVMVTTLLLIAAYIEAVSETLLPANPLYFLIACTYALTLGYTLALRYLPSRRVQVYVQVCFDLLTITGLVYLTGGTPTESGFMLLYPISVLSGSVLLYRRSGLIFAGVAVLLYAAMLWGVRVQRIPAPRLSDLPLLPPKQLFYSVFVTAVVCVTVALIGSYLSEGLRSAGQKLEEAVERVADLQEMQRLIVQSIHSGLITADAAGRVLYLNPFGESMLGVGDAEVRGRSLRDVLGSVLFEPAALLARATDVALSRLQVVYHSPEGAELDLGVSVWPLATADGGFLLSFQNLTEINRLEQEVRLKEKLAAVGEMAAQLAHEIRNPLGSISGSSQVLMAESNLSPEQGHLLAIITKESKRLSDTLNQFLFQARPAAEPHGPVDLGRIVGEAVTLLRNSPEVGERHTVEFHADAGPYVCLGVPHQIEQVFWNLARNGLEAMPEGGALGVHLGQSAGEVVLRIRDEGRGIAREDQRRLFEPFRSGHQMGTGLGLAIVYRIVRDHRGDITIRSMPGQGTEVEVRLPRISLTVSA